MDKQLENGLLTMVLTMDLTANNVPKINLELDALMPAADAYETFELDLRNILNIDSVGVTFVISLYKRVKASHKTFRVAGASSDVQSLFKLMKLDQFFEMRSI